MVKTAAALAVFLAASPAGAAECRLALLLGFDISSSVDVQEDRLQRDGIAAALTAPEVEAAFFAAPLPVALAAFEWSGRYNQELVLDWHLIEAAQDLQQAARTIGASNRSYNGFPTAMGEAMDYARRLMDRAPPCAARTIDIAGDGINNEGPGPDVFYEQPIFENITVNGLVVDTEARRDDATKLITFYAEKVLHGPGAFLIVADGFDDYERAMRLKLLRELGMAVIGKAPLPMGPQG